MVNLVSIQIAYCSIAPQMEHSFSFLKFYMYTGYLKGSFWSIFFIIIIQV